MVFLEVTNELAVVVGSVHRKRKIPLMQIRQTGNRLRLPLDSLEGRHQYRQQQCDNVNNHQQLDKCKSSFTHETTSNKLIFPILIVQQ